MNQDWTVTSGRAPTSELRAARNAAIVAFYGATKSVVETARAFDKNRSFIAEILKKEKALRLALGEIETKQVG